MVEPLSLILDIMRSSKNILLSDGTNLYEHSIWCAHLAIENGQSNDIIVASLLHDIGHAFMFSLDEMGISSSDQDCEHATFGSSWLSRWYPPSVCETVRLHVDAKRYLHSINSEYNDSLSAGSKRSLINQGLEMSEGEKGIFLSNPYYEKALTLREFDDTHYDGSKLPSLDSFHGILLSYRRS